MIAVKEMNDTSKDNGVAPNRILLGTVSRLSIIDTKLPKQKQQMEIIAKAQVEVSAISAKWKFLSVLKQ